MNEEHFVKETKRIQSVVNKALQKANTLAALEVGGRMSQERLQFTLEETAYFFESATLYLRALCEKQMPGVGGYGLRDGLEYQLPSGHIEIAGAGWVHMQIDTLLPHCRYMPATWLTDTVRQLLTAYMKRNNFRLHFKTMLLVIDEHSDVDGRHVFDQDNKGWKAVSNALKGLVIDDDDQYHLSVHMMSCRSAENICHISLVLPDSVEAFFQLHRKGIAYHPLEPSVALLQTNSFQLVCDADKTDGSNRLPSLDLS